MKEDNELLRSLDKLHTTGLGAERIKRNLSLDTNDAIAFYRKNGFDILALIYSPTPILTRSGTK